MSSNMKFSAQYDQKPLLAAISICLIFILYDFCNNNNERTHIRIAAIRFLIKDTRTRSTNERQML